MEIETTSKIENVLESSKEIITELPKEKKHTRLTKLTTPIKQTEAVKEKKTADMKKYYREYMKERYNKDHEKGKNISKTNYYIRKGICTLEDKHIYGEHLAYVVKAKQAMTELKERNPYFFKYVLEEFTDVE